MLYASSLHRNDEAIEVKKGVIPWKDNHNSGGVNPPVNRRLLKTKPVKGFSLNKRQESRKHLFQGDCMGKAADRRNQRRGTFLSQLFLENPERFEFEWEKRVLSWLSDIRMATKDGNMQGPSVFRIVDHAASVLRGCGEEAVRKHGEATRRLLENTCCRALSQQFDKRLYRLNRDLNRASCFSQR